MHDDLILNLIKEFLFKNVAQKVKFKKPNENFCVEEYYDNDDIEQQSEKVNPKVFIGWIPPKNNPLNDYDVPSIVVMADNGEDDGKEAFLKIRLGITTFDPGEQSDTDLVADYSGYRDILNLITRIRMELSNALIGNLSIEKPIKWGMYEEQQYPYWCGYITFDVKVSSLNFSEEIDKFL